MLSLVHSLFKKLVIHFNYTTDKLLANTWQILHKNYTNTTQLLPYNFKTFVLDFNYITNRKIVSGQ